MGRTSWAFRIVLVGTAIAFVSFAILYAVLFGMQIYSARKASKILDRLEALQPSDSYSAFETAVGGCAIENTGSRNTCILQAGAYPVEWALISKLPDVWSNRILRWSYKAGLRYWQLTVSASPQDGRIHSLSLGLYLVGRYEVLGTAWMIADTVPVQYEQFLRTPADRRTYMHWYHITSMPSGEGFGIYATANSTGKELRARRINRKCFVSFQGCDGLCALLPDAIAVLNERGTAWGGCTDVPRSSCELKNDFCKDGFAHSQ